MIEVYKL